MNRESRVCLLNARVLLAALAMLAAAPASAQNQFFPGAPRSGYVFNPLAGTQPIPAQPMNVPSQPQAGVWHIQPPPAAQNSQFPTAQPQNPANTWMRPPVASPPSQLPPGALIDLRTGLPIQVAIGQGIAGQSAATTQRLGVRTAHPAQLVPQPPVFPYQMTPQARQFWRGVRGYGQSDFGQSRGYSSYGQNHFNQTRSGYSRHNQSRAGQSYPQRSFHNQNRFNQTRSNASLYNVVIPYGHNWR